MKLELASLQLILLTWKSAEVSKKSKNKGNRAYHGLSQVARSIKSERATECWVQDRLYRDRTSGKNERAGRIECRSSSNPRCCSVDYDEVESSIR